MTSHGPENMCAPSFEVAPERRITLSVVIEDAPGLARRLAGVLGWRGYAFERVVTQDERDGPGAARLQLVFTAREEDAQVLEALIAAYGPVKAVRRLYTAPVMAQRSEPWTNSAMRVVGDVLGRSEQTPEPVAI